MIRKVKIKIDGIWKVFRTQEKKEFTALMNVKAEIHEKEFVSVIGPSGSGKTTLLSIIAGLSSPTKGKVYMDNKEISGPGRDRGVIFQQDAIFPWRKVLDNVKYGLEIQGIDNKKKDEIAMLNLELVGLKEYAYFFPKELSGGMKKKVAIAMVLANNPEVLLMDEPFGSLDYVTKITLQKELLNIWQKNQKPTLFITHDIEEALFLADRILVFGKGKLIKNYIVPFSRPRNENIRGIREFGEIKNMLWKYFENFM